MPITLRSERNRDSDTLPLQCCVVVLDLCFHCLRYYSARHSTSAVQLRPLLLRLVHGRVDFGWLGDVGAEALRSFRSYPSHTNASKTRFFSKPRRAYKSTAGEFASVTVSDSAENFRCVRLRTVAASRALPSPSPRCSGNTQICVTCPVS